MNPGVWGKECLKTNSPPENSASEGILTIVTSLPIDFKQFFVKERHLVKLFRNQKRGFFIEAGAYDGEMLSNSLYLEQRLGWTGLLVEPNPDAFSLLQLKKRLRS